MTLLPSEVEAFMKGFWIGAEMAFDELIVVDVGDNAGMNIRRVEVLFKLPQAEIVHVVGVRIDPDELMRDVGETAGRATLTWVRGVPHNSRIQEKIEEWKGKGSPFTFPVQPFMRKPCNATPRS